MFNNYNIDENDIFKCYGVIYTSAITRGDNLDLVPDASADTFVNSLNEFILGRGCPQVILPNNRKRGGNSGKKCFVILSNANRFTRD